jgi:hypothetical protein
MVRINLLHDGMAELLKDPGVRADLEARGRRVEAACIASAPVESGEHRASIHMETLTTDRVKVRIVADSDHSALVESRTGHMARSLDAAGGH